LQLILLIWAGSFAHRHYYETDSKSWPFFIPNLPACHSPLTAEAGPLTAGKRK
jgi:hypothetical protein